MKRILPAIGLGAWFLVRSLASCTGPGNDYSEYRRLPEGGWRYSDTLCFNPVHSDSLCAGNLVVAFSHDDSYPYSDLWLEVLSEEVEVSGGGIMPRRDTLHLRLADRYGNWAGHGLGPTYQFADTLPLRIHESGSAVRIKHIMRVDTLAGINQVGLFFVSF